MFDIKDAKPMPFDEFASIAQSLSDKHALFYNFWKLGKIYFSDSFPTAAIIFSSFDGGALGFVFNPVLWKHLDDYNKKFVICHEVLHVALQHGLRKKDASVYNRSLLNTCSDIVVNHLLINKFNFTRSKLQGFPQSYIDEIKATYTEEQKEEFFKHISEPLFNDYRDFCWVENIFDVKINSYLNETTKGKVPRNDLSLERYYNMFPKKKSILVKNSFDCHGEFVDIDGFASVIMRVNDEIDEEDKKDIEDMINKHFQNGDDSVKDKDGFIDLNPTQHREAGTGSGAWSFARVKKWVRPKKKWETIIQKWAWKKIKTVFTNKEQWARTNRRFALIGSDLLLPTEMEDEVFGLEDEKVDCFFFLDTSGSCYSLKDRFFHAAKSLPRDKFYIRLFSFDTHCEELSIDSDKIYGGGGTSFSIIENKIQSICKKENKKYPSVVFLITDGYGNTVCPQYPDRWYWLLDGYSSRNFIPEKSKVFILNEFE